MSNENYGRVFRSMYTGSMYGAGSCVFAVWGWVIANKDENGMVEINPVVLSHTLGDPLERIEKALEYLRSPDPRSRTKIEDGKRLIQVGEFEHKVVTHEVQEAKGKDRTAYWREYKANKRAESAQKQIKPEMSTVDNVDKCGKSTKSTPVTVTATVTGTVVKEEDTNVSLSVGKPTPKELMDYWNSKKRLGKINSMTINRCESLKVRKKDQQFIDHWQEIIDRLDESDFCNGHNDRNWVATIDWVLKNATNYVKVLEGKYNNKPKKITNENYKPGDLLEQSAWDEDDPRFDEIFKKQ
jgi:hypothetical protein